MTTFILLINKMALDIKSLDDDTIIRLRTITNGLSSGKRKEVLGALLDNQEIEYKERPIVNNGTNIVPIETIDTKETIQKINDLTGTDREILMALLEDDVKHEEKEKRIRKELMNLQKNKVSIDDAEKMWIKWKKIRIILPSYTFEGFVSNGGVSEEYLKAHPELEEQLYSGKEIRELFVQLKNYLNSIWIEINEDYHNDLRDITTDSIIWSYLDDITKYFFNYRSYKLKDTMEKDGKLLRTTFHLDIHACWYSWFWSCDDSNPDPIFSKI